MIYVTAMKFRYRKNSEEIRQKTCVHVFFRPFFLALSSGNRKQMFFFLNRAGSGVLPSSSVYSHVYSFTLRPSLFFLWSECNFSLVFSSLSLCRPFPHSHFCLMLAGWCTYDSHWRREHAPNKIIPTKNPTWKKRATRLYKVHRSDPMFRALHTHYTDFIPILNFWRAPTEIAFFQILLVFNTWQNWFFSSVLLLFFH